MSTVLFAYEFGGGLGHLTHLIAIARRLAPEHRLCFALPNAGSKLDHVRRALGDDIRVIEGVAWPVDRSRVRPLDRPSFATPLSLYNFDDASRLRTASQHWARVLADEKPDLVVSDFAPSLRLALQGRVPIVVAGNGYAVMPPGRPLPPSFPWQTTVSARNRALEARIVAAINDIRAETDGPAVDYLSDLFQGDETFVCTFPLFDPYRAYRAVAALAPCNLPAMETGPPMSERRGPAVLVYLPENHRSLGNVLAALGTLDVQPHLYISGADPRAIAARCKANVVIHTAPVDFTRTLPRCRLLVHHSGLGTAHCGLMAGTPQLLLPHASEHMITARALVRTGGSVLLQSRDASIEAVRHAIQSMLADESIGDAALRAAERLAPMRAIDPAGLVAGACRRLLSA